MNRFFGISSVDLRGQVISLVCISVFLLPDGSNMLTYIGHVV